MKLAHLGNLVLAFMFAASTAMAHGLAAQQLEHLTTDVRFSEDGLVACGIDNLQAQEMLVAGDQPLLRFTAHEGVKPVATITDPRVEAFYILEFGVHNVVLDKILPAKKATDLKNIVPLRHKGYFTYVKQMDKKFRGFRKIEAPFAAVVEDAMSMLGMLNMKDYQGTFFKDEYNTGMPMVFTLDNVNQLRNLQEYFIKNEVVARANKPWLVLEILKNPEAVTEADKAFWGSYFELAKRSDPGMEDVLRRERELRMQIAPIGSRGKYIRNTVPEIMLLRLEKLCDDLKTNDVALKLAAGAALTLWALADKHGVQPTITGLTCQKDDQGKLVKDAKGNPIMKESLKSGIDTAVTIGKYTAAGVLAYALYRLWVNAFDTAAHDEELNEEAQNVEALSA